MQLYDPHGRPKYLTPLERDAFLRVASLPLPKLCTFCETLACTGRHNIAFL